MLFVIRCCFVFVGVCYVLLLVSSVVACWLFACVSSFLFVVVRWLLYVVYDALWVVQCMLFVVGCVLFVAHWLLLGVC